MREWFTPQDLAGLPCLPTTEQRIRSRAKREGWKNRKRQTGKGFEYHVSSLPLKTQLTLNNANETNIAIESPNVNSVGNRLRSERLGLTQKATANIAGCSSHAWQVYELGKSTPGGKILATLHQQGVDIIWVLTGDKQPINHMPVRGMTHLEMKIFDLAVKTSYECQSIIGDEMSSMTQAVLIGDLIQLMMRRKS